MEAQSSQTDDRTPEQIRRDFLAFKRVQVDPLLDAKRQANWARKDAERAANELAMQGSVEVVIQ